MNLFPFDTRDKKPKLYHLLTLTGVVLGVVAAIVIFRPHYYVAINCMIIAAYCLGASLLLFYSFREQIRYNPYSYNTILYFGFALFALFVMITHIILSIQAFSNPEVYDAISLIHPLLNSAQNYMIISIPFILLFSIALFVSNVSLLIHERKRFVNILGILLSFFLIAGEVFLFRFDYYVSGSQTEVMIHDLFTNLFAAFYLYFECMLIGAIVASAIVVRHQIEKPVDFLIILGCGIRKDGTPTPLLRGRVDRAIRFYEQQKASTGKELIFIPSGGQGADEVVAESTAMKNYLLERGIPERLIIEENRSTSTFENMKFSKQIIQRLDPNGSVAFATTNYHVFRSGLYARRVKMRAVGMGAKTKWYFWPNAAVREFVGLLTNHRLKQALVLGSMVVLYVVLTVLAYQA